MIISRTPFRISFFGGGTDYPDYYEENGGTVLSTTIDKYCYISCRLLPPFFKYKSRIIYTNREEVNNVSEIHHPSVRETLRYLEEDRGLHVSHDGDLPARTGIGSSSSFTVGLLNSVYALQGKMVTKKKLALDAIHVEQDMIREHVGSQDQTAAAFGGFNRIEFKGRHSVDVRPVTLDPKKLDHFQNHLMLFFTGFSRTASDIADHQIKAIPQTLSELKTMRSMVDDGIEFLFKGDFDGFGRLLHESWMIKRSLTQHVTNHFVDEIYQSAMNAGALGGKLMGAGGGGFILFYVNPEQQPVVRERLKKLPLIPFRFDNTGSQIVYFKPDQNF